ncbi:hypothetical protein C8R47DRAFT_301770 [Mycena vitilis]|nr:hypothetical protein C8R47DRAFT_301770 [Mycena vitilis]
MSHCLRPIYNPRDDPLVQWENKSCTFHLMSFTSLEEELVLLICLELPLTDITSLRQVCRTLCDATRAKILWINILTRRACGDLLPRYLKGYDLLGSIELEALVRRALRLAHKWETGNLAPVNSWRLYLPQSITWLRLVNGTWLFVASSDTDSSKISCWELSMLFQGYAEPLAEAFLPGQVKTAKLEVQASGIVIALGLGGGCSSVHVITLRQHLGRHVFCELSRIENSTHVLMLRGNFIGCALRHGVGIPHIIDWTDTRIYDISPPPGGLDTPGRRNVPHLMTMWNGFVVVLRKTALEFYTVPSTSDPIMFVKFIKTPTIWEAVVCNSVSPSSADTPPLRLVVITPVGIEICVIEDHMLRMPDDTPTCLNFCLAQAPQLLHCRDPLYRLCVTENGRRSLWLSIDEQETVHDPHVVYTTIPELPCDTEMPRISWTNNPPDQLALWGTPLIDFDDALGLTVIGNCFGELAVHDQDGRYPERCGGLAMDFTVQPTTALHFLPTMPVSLGLSPNATGASKPEEPDSFVILRWSQDPLILDESWSTNWLSPYPGYYHWEQWLGVPCDIAWLLEHAYGFPEPAIPQAFSEDLDNCRQHLLFRSGQREPEIGHFHVQDAQPESEMRRTARTEGNIYRTMFSREIHPTYPGEVRRNRWEEQAARAGRH